MTVLKQPKSQYKEAKEKTTVFFRNFPQHAQQYAKSLLPIADWLPRYNWTWFTGDIIAGLTVGLVVLPQAIAYSTKLANLPAQVKE
jgi:solute carrier family 26 (sodium-independent sulfate anion transporter), member 11